jgi:hypothetical protein
MEDILNSTISLQPWNARRVLAFVSADRRNSPHSNQQFGDVAQVVAFCHVVRRLFAIKEMASLASRDIRDHSSLVRM